MPTVTFDWSLPLADIAILHRNGVNVLDEANSILQNIVTAARAAQSAAALATLNNGTTLQGTPDEIHENYINERLGYELFKPHYVTWSANKYAFTPPVASGAVPRGALFRWNVENLSMTGQTFQVDDPSAAASGIAPGTRGAYVQTRFGAASSNVVAYRNTATGHEGRWYATPAVIPSPYDYYIESNVATQAYKVDGLAAPIAHDMGPGASVGFRLSDATLSGMDALLVDDSPSYTYTGDAASNLQILAVPSSTDAVFSKAGTAGAAGARADAHTTLDQAEHTLRLIDASSNTLAVVRVGQLPELPAGSIPVDVSVASDASNAYYVFSQAVSYTPGEVYTFVQSDATNRALPLGLSAADGAAYTAGTSRVGVPGATRAHLRWQPQEDAPDALYPVGPVPGLGAGTTFTRAPAAVVGNLGDGKANFASGLKYEVYEGYFSTPSNLHTQTLVDSGITAAPTLASLQSNNNYTVTTDKSILFYGFFRATETGDHTFSLTSDDASYLWLGSSASNTSNLVEEEAVINNGGLHAPTTVSNTVLLNAGEFVPCAIVYGQNLGGAELSVDVQTPSGSTPLIDTLSFHRVASAATTLAVTVTQRALTPIFAINGVPRPSLTLERFQKVVFDQSDATNASHPLVIDDAGAEAVSTGTPGTAGAKLEFTPTAALGSNLTYRCGAHANMGGAITLVTPAL